MPFPSSAKKRKTHAIERVMERFNGICHLCGNPVERISQASRDHLDPSKGHGIENYALAHRTCNTKRGPMTVEEYRAILRLPRSERVEARKIKFEEHGVKQGTIKKLFGDNTV